MHSLDIVNYAGRNHRHGEASSHDLGIGHDHPVVAADGQEMGNGYDRVGVGDFLEEVGLDRSVVEYLKTPPTRERLEGLYAKAGISARQGLRTRGSPAEELGLLDASDDVILDAMVKDPILVERPLVETEKGVRLCRPQEVVREIL